MKLEVIKGSCSGPQRSTITGNIAVYLVSQGPYSNRRLVELQYLRIKRFINYVDIKEQYGIEITGILPPFTDVLFGEYDSFSQVRLDAFEGLVERYRREPVGGLFVDIDISKSSNVLGKKVLSALAALNIPFINIFTERHILAKYLDLNYIDDYGGLLDADDFVGFFPKLTENLVLHLKHLEDINFENGFHETFYCPKKELTGRLDKYPYMFSSIPRISDAAWHFEVNKHSLDHEERTTQNSRIKIWIDSMVSKAGVHFLKGPLL